MLLRFQNCEVDDAVSLSRGTMKCRHVTANYYVNPPWLTPTQTQRLLPSPPVPSAPLPGAGSPCPAVYCPMDGTLRRLDRASPPAVPDDTAAAVYVPMDVNLAADGSSFPQTGNDVIDIENIYEPLSDVISSECENE